MLQPLADSLKRLLLAGFGALSVADVQGSYRISAEVAHRQRGAHGGIHAATECYHDLGCLVPHSLKPTRPSATVPR